MNPFKLYVFSPFTKYLNFAYGKSVVVQAHTLNAAQNIVYQQLVKEYGDVLFYTWDELLSHPVIEVEMGMHLMEWNLNVK